MSKEEHDIQHEKSIGPHGRTNRYTCANDNCEISATGQYRAGDEIQELAEEFACPANSTCLKCNKLIEPETDICQKCYRQLSVSWRTY